MADEFLGTGWAFPVRVDHLTGRVAMASGSEDIEQSIRIILFTAKGERVMRPEFGCGIHDYAFESMSTTMLGMAESMVAEALARWEPRIEVMSVTASAEHGETGRMNVELRYRIRATNQQYNRVYPFYLREG